MQYLIKCLLILLKISYFFTLINANEPKLNVITRHAVTVFNDKTTIDIKANSSLRLKCDGSKPIYWTFPDNDPESTSVSSLASIKSKCIKNRKPICYSDVIFNNLNYTHTGLYSCHYNNSNKILIDSIYVFINDPDNLIVPYDGSDEYIIVPILKNTSNVIIPCKPTNSKAVVSLELYDMPTENFIEMPKNKIRFDPTIGFYVNNYDFGEYNALDCRVKLGKREQDAGITVYEISHNRIELFPFIDVSPNSTLVGDEVTLICSVNIEGNTFIEISWDYKNDDQRKVESSPVTVTKQTNSGVFETVSRTLSIKNATNDDSGLYACNVTDFGGNTYRATKDIVIRSSLIEHVNNHSYLNSGSIRFCDQNIISYFSFLIIFVINVSNILEVKIC